MNSQRRFGASRVSPLGALALSLLLMMVCLPAVAVTSSSSAFQYGSMSAASWLQLGLRQTHFTSITTVPEQDQQASDVRARLTLQPKEQFKDKMVGSLYKLDIHGIYSLDEHDDNHVVVPAAFYRWQQGAQSLAFGRMQRDYLAFDEAFGLGLVQPTFTWDPLEVEQQGLTGLYYQTESTHWTLTGFVSYINLPDQGADFSIDDGNIRSSNRWFTSPAERVWVGNASSQLNYQLNEPNVADVIWQPGVFLEAQYHTRSRNRWIKAFYAYKPINQFHLGVDAQVKIPANQQSKTNLIITPYVARHHLYAIESGMDGRILSGAFAVVVERVERPVVPEAQIESKLNDMVHLGFTLDRYMPEMGLPRVQTTLRGLWQVETSESPKEQALGNQVDEAMDRFRFQKALGAGVNWNAMNKGPIRLFVGVEYLYSFDEEGEIASLMAHMVRDRHWNYRLRFDVLGASGRGDYGFISKNQANDRILGEVSYVF